MLPQVDRALVAWWSWEKREPKTATFYIELAQHRAFESAFWHVRCGVAVEAPVIFALASL